LSEKRTILRTSGRRWAKARRTKREEDHRREASSRGRDFRACLGKGTQKREEQKSVNDRKKKGRPNGDIRESDGKETYEIYKAQSSQIGEKGNARHPVHLEDGGKRGRSENQYAGTIVEVLETGRSGEKKSRVGIR